MEFIELVASEMVDGKKVTIATEKNFPIAQTIADVLEMENVDNGWNAEEIVACFNYGSRVKRQTQLRAKDAPKKVALTPNQQKFATMTAEKQEEILRQHGLI